MGSLEDLEHLDQEGLQVVHAIAPGDPEDRRRTRTKPFTVIGEDGSTYWVKTNAVFGLVTELVCGRIASRLQVGPSAVILRVDCALVPQERGNEFTDPNSLYVGVRDIPDAVNSKDLSKVLNNSGLSPPSIQEQSRAAVIAFQSWIGLGDAQVMVGLSDGQVHSIDHEEAFQRLNSPNPINVVIATIPGVPDTVGKSGIHIDAASSAIEAISDDELLSVVSQIPSGSAWNGDRQHRFDIVQWLVARRTLLRSRLEAWLQA